MGKWTRRGVITSGVLLGGGLLVGVALRPGHRAPALAPMVASDDESLVNAWVKLSPDNVTTVIVPHSEMGQGAQTALAQMLADEMDADWNLVRFEEAPAVAEYANYALGKGVILGDAQIPDIMLPTVDGAFLQLTKALGLQITGGSSSIRATGVLGMRVAGAAAREMMKTAASETWQVPVAELTTADSHVIHEPNNMRAKYSELAAAAAELTPPTRPLLKEPEAFKIMGQSVPRHDIPSKVDGTALFAMDVHLPDMLYATVQRAPVFGGKISSVDDTAARQMPGVVDVIRLDGGTQPAGSLGTVENGDAISVVAEGYWQAKQGLSRVDVKWQNSVSNAVSSDTIFKQFDTDLTEKIGRKTDFVVGDVAEKFAKADRLVDADYQVPFLAHTCMEPLNATARITETHCELWVGCQNPLGFRNAVAETLGMDAENVTVHNHFMGGGFGRKANPDYAIQAAKIAAAVGRPVQLIWSREEDVRQDFYRPAVMSRFRAALDAQGRVQAWENTYVDKHEPVEAPLVPYSISSQDIGHVASTTHVPFGAWRSVDHSQHGFFTECFIDELAHAANMDAYEYRAALLKDKPRHLAVLQKAAEKANWHSPLAAGRGRGIAIQESFGSLVAEVIEVSVANGDVIVDRVVAVVDAGFAISPDGLIAQIESGIVYGLTAALYGEISIENGAVRESNFHDYEALRMAQAPAIETHIINSGADLGGAGEPGTPAVAPALANAVFNATGNRIRQLPLKNHYLRDRIDENDDVA